MPRALPHNLFQLSEIRTVLTQNILPLSAKLQQPIQINFWDRFDVLAPSNKFSDVRHPYQPKSCHQQFFGGMIYIFFLSLGTLPSISDQLDAPGTFIIRLFILAFERA
ncbi:hypothetical protein [Microseira wollei]|uniref:hypothetical protein n=1 Tax=Microseira wollei TaxID=467598 RepID=UPI001CFC64F0|nr:hypothetical protein [Microseira wollei]